MSASGILALDCSDGDATDCCLAIGGSVILFRAARGKQDSRDAALSRARIRSFFVWQTRAQDALLYKLDLCFAVSLARVDSANTLHPVFGTAGCSAQALERWAFPVPNAVIAFTPLQLAFDRGLRLCCAGFGCDGFLLRRYG